MPGLEMCGLLQDTTINFSRTQKELPLSFLPALILIYEALGTRWVIPSDLLLNASGTRSPKTQRQWGTVVLTDQEGPKQGRELKGFQVCSAKRALWWEHS